MRNVFLNLLVTLAEKSLRGQDDFIIQTQNKQKIGNNQAKVLPVALRHRSMLKILLGSIPICILHKDCIALDFWV